MPRTTRERRSSLQGLTVAGKKNPTACGRLGRGVTPVADYGTLVDD